MTFDVKERMSGRPIEHNHAFSKDIRETGERARADQTKSHAAHLEKQGNVANEANRADRAEQAKTADARPAVDANPANQTQKPDAPARISDTRTAEGESQQKDGSGQQQKTDGANAQDNRTQASMKFLEARADAAGLKDLVSKAPTASQTATPDAPAQAQNAAQANLARQDQGAKQPAKTEQKGAKPNAKSKDSANAKDADKTQKGADSATVANNASDAAKAAQGQALEVRGTKVFDSEAKEDRTEGEAERSREEHGTGREKSGFAVGSKGRSAKRGLESLLGGNAGAGGEGTSDAGSDIASEAVANAAIARADAKKVPQEIDEFGEVRVYSEFASDKVGPETYAVRARYFNKYVEQRLGDIAKLDQRLEREILALSERVVGDIRITASEFNGSVYGKGAIHG